MFACVGVFAYPEEIIKGNCAEVCNCFLPVGLEFCSFVNNLVDYSYRDCYFVVWRWVSPLLSLKEALEWFVVLLCS